MSKIVVDANSSSYKIDLKELRHYRDLFYILAYRDLRVRYAQTFLGFIWALLQPLATLLIFILVFGMALKVDTGGIPYPLFAISGISMWTYFGFVLNQSGNSVIGAQEMIKKIYFPRLVIPLSKAVVGFVDFGVALLMLVLLMVVYEFSPSINIIFAPLFIFAQYHRRFVGGYLAECLDHPLSGLSARDPVSGSVRHVCDTCCVSCKVGFR
jgi:lipopolysaccharide transport system permease protein